VADSDGRPHRHSTHDTIASALALAAEKKYVGSSCSTGDGDNGGGAPVRVCSCLLNHLLRWCCARSCPCCSTRAVRRGGAGVISYQANALCLLLATCYSCCKPKQARCQVAGGGGHLRVLRAARSRNNPNPRPNRTNKALPPSSPPPSGNAPKSKHGTRRADRGTRHGGWA
jgi:hypothetical protein